MKVEQKLSDFSAKKQKRNKNMKTETEICGMEMENKFFLAEMEQRFLA
jgi:hypothetical protein